MHGKLRRTFVRYCRLHPLMLRDQHEIAEPTPPRNDAHGAADDYLDILNAEQRHAVEHDCADSPDGGRALLIIAGAGSGKTNTLAYRVAHLVRRGAVRSEERRVGKEGRWRGAQGQWTER